MKNFLGKSAKIVGASLAMFLASQTLPALTPTNISEVRTSFRANDLSYVVLQDGSVTPKEKEGLIIYNNGQWLSQSNEIMSGNFQSELVKALEMADKKKSENVKLADMFEYANDEGEVNCFNLWEDGTISFGPYQILKEGSWFYDRNNNERLDDGETMTKEFNDLADTVYVNARYSRAIAKQIAEEPIEVVPAITTAPVAEAVTPVTVEETTAPTNMFTPLNYSPEDYHAVQNELVTESITPYAPITNPYANGIANWEAEEVIPITPYAPITNPYANGIANWNAGDMVIDPSEIPTQTPVARKGLDLTTDLNIVTSGTGDIDLGLRYNFENGLGLGVKAGIGLGKKEQTDSYEGVVSATTGRKFKGTITREDILRLKLGLEARLGLFVLEGGVIYMPTIETTNEQVIGRTGNVLTENSYSISGNQVDYFGGVGLELGKPGKITFRALVGGETEKGAYVKLGIGIPLSKN